MIITVQKPDEEIKEMIGDHDKLFLVGCGTCATECKTGGEEEVKSLRSKPEKIGKKVTGYIIVESICDYRLTRRDLKRSSSALESSDAIACALSFRSVR